MPPQVKFKPILVNELEKLSYINTIAQDRHGFIWIGAVQGLARYDGYEIKTYSTDTSSIADNWVKDLLIDSRGELWAVTHSGLCQYLSEQDEFDCKTLYSDNDQQQPVYFYAMFEDSRGKVWVSTSQGVQLFNKQTQRFFSAPAVFSETLPPVENTEDNFVHEIEEDKHGELWFALENNGVARFNPETNELRHFRANTPSSGGLTGNQVREILVDSNNNVWVGSLGGGLNIFNRESGEFEAFLHSNNEKAIEIWALHEDDDGVIWIGDGSGLHLYQPATGKVAAYSYQEGAADGPGNFVAREIVSDSAGGIWVGYFPSGVDQVDLLASEFINYRHNPDDPSSLPDGGVLSTLEADDGKIWVGCGFGLGLLDRQSGQFTRFAHQQDKPDSLTGSTVLDLAKGSDGSIWVGSWNKGLNRLRPNAGGFEHYQHNPAQANSLYGHEPWGILATRDGELWVATEKGINHYRPESDDFEQVMPKNADGKAIDSLYSRYIYEAPSGLIWVASFNGLYALDPKSKSYVHHYTHDPDSPGSLSSNQVLSVLRDSQGLLWVGTNGAGLNLYQEASDDFKHFSTADGLPNMAISGIIEDQQTNVWFSTFQGLVKYDRQTKRFAVFDKHDGPLGDLYNRNSPSLLSTGELLFGSSRGLTVFNPSKVKSNEYIPPVVLTEFSIFNTPVDANDDGPLRQSITHARELDLEYQHSVFSFEFAALSFVNPAENQYAYRMTGFERDWNSVGDKRTATYTNLDPGIYTFQVKASNSSGLWNNEPLEVQINISPPYWQSPLAYFLYMILACTAGWFLWRDYHRKLAFERRKLKQERAIVKRLKEIDVLKDEINRNLDKKVAERTEELQQKHKRLVDAQNELKQLNDKLSEVSVTDQLTGLKNRRFLHQSIEDDIALVNREYQTGFAPGDERNDLTFLLLDLDFFKSINDEFGHKGGDEILVQVSEILRSTMRDTDYVVRWGGEEFVVVIRHLPRQRVSPIAERLRNTIRDFNFSLQGNKNIRQSCSIGLATYPFCQTQPRSFNWEQVMNMADKALYAAKASGRNCWVWLESAEKFPYSSQPQMLEKTPVASAIKRGHLQASSNRARNELVW